MRHLVIKPPPGFPSESCTRAVQDFQSLLSQKVGPTQVKAGTKNLALKPCRTPLEEQDPPYHRPHLCRCLKTVFMSRCSTRSYPIKNSYNSPKTRRKLIRRISHMRPQAKGRELRKPTVTDCGVQF